jgi:nickel-dependent lactate racemase
MVVVGTDHFGKEARINRLAVDSKAILVISSVEPHYFAGYTGGRKSFFPGLADLATVERNHNLANSLDAAPLRLAGNPVAEHLDELISMFDSRRVLSIQTVLDVEGKLAGLFVGELKSTFEQGVELADKIYAHSVTEPFDTVICSMESPLDKNLYQTQKGLENCQAAVKNGGNIILVSACNEGIGSRHFYELAQQWDVVSNKPHDGIQRFGSHKLSRVLSTKKRIGVRLFTEMDHDEARRVFYDPLDDINQFIHDNKQSDQQYTVAVVDDAGSSVLNLRPDVAR